MIVIFAIRSGSALCKSVDYKQDNKQLKNLIRKMSDNH